MFRFDKSKVALANKLAKVQEDNEILRAENRRLSSRYSPEYVVALKDENRKLRKRVEELETFVEMVAQWTERMN